MENEVQFITFEKHPEYYQMYLDGKITFKRMSDYLGCSVSALKRYFKTRNITTRLEFIHNPIKHDFFDNIDSEIKAYLLGFYFADGCIRGNRFSIALTENDVEIINLFKKYLAPNVSIRYIKSRKNKKTGYISKPLAMFGFSSQKLCETLTKYGIGNNKTYNVTTDFSYVPVELFSHFLRGYYDGDGTCYYGVIRKGTPKEGVNVSWSIISRQKEHLLIIQNRLLQTGITTNIMQEKRGGNFLLSINSKKEFIKIREFLYNNASFFLQRKKEKIYSFVIEDLSLNKTVVRVDLDTGNKTVYSSLREAARNAGVSNTTIKNWVKNKQIKLNSIWKYK